MSASVAKILDEAIAAAQVQAATLLVARDGEPLQHQAFGGGHGAARPRIDRIFDLASLTKVLATTSAVMMLLDEGRLALETRVSDVLSSLALDALFSKESEAYEQLYQTRLIGGDFGAGYQAEAGFGYAVIGGETPDAGKLEAEVIKILKQARKRGIDPDILERKRRKYLGQFLRAFNEPEGTAYAYIGALGQGSELFDVPGMIDKITVRQVNQRINELLTPNNYAASVLLPQ